MYDFKINEIKMISDTYDQGFKASIKAVLTYIDTYNALMDENPTVESIAAFCKVLLKDKDGVN